MGNICEIAPDVFRISVHVPQIDLQFNEFLIRDDEPLLYHTGQAALLPEILPAVKFLIDPSSLRWIGFSHFESDECGTLNRWLDIAPHGWGASLLFDDTEKVLFCSDLLLQHGDPAAISDSVLLRFQRELARVQDA